jgi:multiple sugar transport system permease protein
MGGPLGSNGVSASRTRVKAGALVALLFASPVVLMVLGSFRRPGVPPPDGLVLIPASPRSRNYIDATSLVPLLHQIVNSLSVVAVAVPVTVLVASLAGFAIVTSAPRTRRALVAVSVLAMIVPVSALWVPRTVILDQLGLTDHTLTVAAPALMATTPLYVLLFALALSRLPRSLFEAAEVEGLSPLRTWWRVAVPLSRPTAFAVGVLAFVAHWSNVVEPLLWLSREHAWTAALGLRSLASLEPSQYPLMLAAAVIVTAPAVFLFVLAQRAFFDDTLGAAR